MGERRSRTSGSHGRPRSGPETFTRLTVTVADQEGYAVVTVVGEVDVTTGSQLRDPLRDLADRGLCDHVVDLRAVTFLDSTGLGILVGDHKRLRDRGGSLQVVCGAGLVSRVFRLTGVDRVVPVRDSVEDAVAILTQPNSA
jgi:anti-sigma B factor antagonist